jgi:hypothetical protein
MVVGGGYRKLGDGGTKGLVGILGRQRVSVHETLPKMQDGSGESLWRLVYSKSSDTEGLLPPSWVPGPCVRNACSPHDRVDGCPYKQYNFVQWAPGQLLGALTPTRHPITSEYPDQNWPQVGQAHKDRPLRPHSPQGGKNLKRQRTC